MIKMKNLLKIYSLLALISMLVGMLFIAVPWDNLPTKDISVVATFALNGLLWGGLLFSELTKRAYSLIMIHWLFCFLFFFCIAFVQYMYGVFPWIVSCEDGILLQENLLLFFWTLFVWIGYRISFSKKKQKNAPVYSFHIPAWLIMGLTCFAVVNMCHRVATSGFISLLARATASVSYGTESSAMGLFVGHTLQALSFFAVVFSLASYRQKHKGFIWVILTGLCLLVSYFPTALSRNAAAAIYGGFLLIACRSLRCNRLFILALLGGFLVVLPFLNAFRNTAFLDVNLWSAVCHVVEHLADDWLAGDYDAYAMFGLILKHVQYEGITWGMQFLGVILFWVPRVWWTTKPIGTGAFVTTHLGWQFTNVSAPLPAEGFINLGGGISCLRSF